MRNGMLILLTSGVVLVATAAYGQGRPVVFDLRSVRSGRWSDPCSWSAQRMPRAGDRVQVRARDKIVYDIVSDQAIRMLHVAGTLSFARDRDTRLDVGLLKVQPGDEASEDGFNCDAHPDPAPARAGAPVPTLEIGTPEAPIPAAVTAVIRLVYFEGADKETTPAIIVCGGRWEAHGAPLSHTWVKLGATANAGDRLSFSALPLRAGGPAIAF